MAISFADDLKGDVYRGMVAGSGPASKRLSASTERPKRIVRHRDAENI
jgi:hypothetical protein